MKRNVVEVVSALELTSDEGKEVVLEIDGVRYPIHDIYEDSQEVVLVYDYDNEDAEMR